MEPQEKTIEELQKQAEEYLNGWKRAKADFVNYQKQVEREKAEWAMFSSAGCIKAMLPVLDSLEAAVIQKIDDRLHGEGEYDEGIERVRTQMVETLRQMGVEQIKSIGEPVNIEFHEVVGVEKSEEHASGLIVKEAQRGYTMHGKALRVAKVIVSQ